MRILISQRLAVCCLLFTIGITPAAASEDAVEIIFSALKDRVAGLEKDKIAASQVEGLYTVTIGFDTYYVTANGEYLINGDIIELATGTNISESGLAAKRQQMISSVPEEDLIVYPATTDKKTEISIFTDTTCPYCRKLHEQVPALVDAGIDVRYLAFPRAGAQSQVAIDMASIWCADDKPAAMTASKEGRPVKPASCENPVASQYALGVSMQIRGTPAIILENGEIIAGYVPAETLIARALAATD